MFSMQVKTRVHICVAFSGKSKCVLRAENAFSKRVSHVSLANVFRLCTGKSAHSQIASSVVSVVYTRVRASSERTCVQTLNSGLQTLCFTN